MAVNVSLPVSTSLRVYDNILQTIGHTPLVHLQHIGRSLPCPLYAKIEFFNPGGSVKDRIGLNMIEEAEHAGRLKPGGTLVEVHLRQHRRRPGNRLRLERLQSGLRHAR